MDIVEKALAEFGSPDAAKECENEAGTDLELDGIWAQTPELWSPGQMKMVEGLEVMSPKFSAGKSHQQMINASKKNKKGKKEKKVAKKDETQKKAVNVDGKKKKGVKKDGKNEKYAKLTEEEKQSPKYLRRKFASKAYHAVHKLIMKKLGDKTVAKEQARLAHRQAVKMWDECGGKF